MKCQILEISRMSSIRSSLEKDVVKELSSIINDSVTKKIWTVSWDKCGYALHWNVIARLRRERS